MTTMKSVSIEEGPGIDESKLGHAEVRLVPALRRGRWSATVVCMTTPTHWHAYHRGELCPHEHQSRREASDCHDAWCPGVCPHNRVKTRVYGWAKKDA